MPCISINAQELITQELVEDSSKLMNLHLQLHGEMLSEIIFKQFVIGDSRPTSAITLAPYDDNKDEARLYTQEISEFSDTPSKENFLDSEEYKNTSNSQLQN